MRTWIVLVWSLVLISVPLQAQWIQTGEPDGGNVTSLAANNTYIFAGVWNGGVYRSSDLGGHWYLSATGLTETSLACIAAKGDTIYAGTYSGLFCSTNSGTSWTGTSLSGVDVRALVLFGSTIFAATMGGGVFRSTDDGASWDIINNGLTQFQVTSLLRVNSTIFAGTIDGVFRTTDNGGNWTAVNNGISITYGGYNLGIDALATDGTYLYAGYCCNGGNLFRSSDDGANWTLLDSGVPGMYNGITELVIKGTNLFIGEFDHGGVYRSTNFGSNWVDASAGIINGSVRSMMVAGSDLFIGTDGGGVFRSTNDGAVWADVSNGIRVPDIRGMVVSSQDLFTATWGNGIFRSTDGGGSWLRTGSGLPRPWVSSIARLGSDLYAAPQSNGVYWSTNQGATWSQRGLASIHIAKLEIGISDLYALSTDTLYRSTNGGLSWQATVNGMTTLPLRSLAAATDSFLIAGGTNGKVYVSTDRAANWSLRNTGIPSGIEVPAVGIAGNVLYAGTDVGMYISNDTGNSWTQTHSNPTYDVCPIGENVFTGAWTGGVQLTLNKGLTWSEWNDGLSGYPNVREYAPFDSMLYLIQAEHSIYRRPLREMLPSITGVVFNDQNGNAIIDSGDPGLSGWKVWLTKVGDPPDSTLTGANGGYEFSELQAGLYTVTQEHRVEWSQSYPAGNGSHSILISTGGVDSGNNFGNTYGYLYTGPPTGTWSDSSHWAGNAPPGPSTTAFIPANVTVTVDTLPVDTIRALRIAEGGALTFSANAGRLKVAGTVELDKDAVLQFSAINDSAGMVCYGDWINRGTIDPGLSRVIMAGDRWKTLIADGTENTFYTLEIDGDSTNGLGNIVVLNELVLHKGLQIRNEDTLRVEAIGPGAISDTGLIPAGTVMRKIRSGETGSYRFESPLTTISFDGGGAYPDYVAVRALPDSAPKNFSLPWLVMGGSADTGANTISVDSVKNFSKWAMGLPRPTRPGQGVPLINREYSIELTGGAGISARLQLRYDQAEIQGSLADESQLVLLRGPFIVDTFQTSWNLVSVPLATGETAKDSLFPVNVGDAFAYDYGYAKATHLELGRGYWMKFGGPQSVLMIGEDFPSRVNDVNVGWNLIGTLSYPIGASDVTSDPPGIIAGPFFGYAKSYVRADSLFPYHAYWVKVNASGTLMFSGAEQGHAFVRQPARIDATRLGSLTISDAAENSAVLYFGSEGDSGDDISYDLPPIPPDGAFDVRYATGTSLELADPEFQRMIPISITSEAYPVTISWTAALHPTGSKLGLDGKNVSLASGGSVTIRNPQSNISLTLPGIGSNREVPREYVLELNYPNPFNPTTAIRYQLPVNSAVSLKIYDMLGRVVQTLVDGPQEAGYKRIEWDAGNFSSGVYFYRIDAAGTEEPSRTFSHVRKMLLLR
jgi:hypothetical protein